MIIIKFMWKWKDLEESEQFWKGTKFIYYKATLSRQCDICRKIGIQISWTELSPEINPSIYGQLIFNKGIKTTQRGKGNLFNKQLYLQHILKLSQNGS